MKRIWQFKDSTLKRWGSLAIVIMFILGIAVHYSYAVFHAEDPALVHKGIADLRGYKWSEGQTLQLNGTWRFNPNVLMATSEVTTDGTYKHLPGLWHPRNFFKKTDGDSDLLLKKATYSATLKIDPTLKTLALRFQEIRMAARIFVNGQLVYEQEAKGQSKPWEQLQKPILVELPPKTSVYTIIIQIQNPYDQSGGITHPIEMGEVNSIYKGIYLKAATGLAFSVVFFMLAVYLMIVFMITKIQSNDGTFFTLGLYMLFVSIASLIYGEHSVFYLMSDAWFGLYYQLLAFCFVLLYVLAFIYVWSVTRNHIAKWAGRTITGGLILIACSTFFWSKDILVNWTLSIGLSLFPVFVVLFGISVFRYIRCIQAKQAEPFTAKVLMFKILIFLLLLFLMVDQFMYTTGWVHQMTIAGLAFTGNTLLFTVMIAYRYQISIKKSDDLSAKLELSLQEKDSFLSETALELKAPLSGIVSTSEAVLGNFGSELPAPILQDLTHIHQSSTRLALLVDELIDLNRMKNGTLLLEKTVFDIGVLISNLLEILDHSLFHRDVELVWEREDFPFLVQADESRVSQILYNLLINAIQNTLQGTIEIIIDYNDHQEIVIMILDTGTGIPETALEHIFEPYSRRYRGFKGSEGIGLGLSIAKQLAVLNGGDITVDSKVGVGSCFTVNLPCAKSETVAELLTHGWAMAELKRDKEDQDIASDAISTEILSNQNRIAHILVIDDDAAALRVYQRLLNENNMTGFMTTSGKKALGMLERGHIFDAIVLDMMMPEISGFEVLKEIRGRYNLYELPVLMITGASGLLDVSRSFEFGANDVIQKPVDGAAFINRIKTLTQLKKYVLEARNSEMAFLQAQIKPHFLFNTLNTIASLCAVDGEAAENLTLELAQFLRTTFDFNHMESYVTLERELEMVKHYLNIEKARFGSKLNFQIDLEPDVSIMVPPLILQPLVENAVKHGVTQKRGGGKVWVKISKAGPDILFVIQDDGIGMSDEKVNEVLSKESYRGVGLMNIELRLKGLYNTELLIFSQEGIGTTISFLIPNRFE